MKYYIISGEASGDLHGANLMKGLCKADPEAVFRFWGGDRMAEVGGAENLARHYKSASFFGAVEVVRNLRTILSQLNQCQQDVLSYNPDVLILVDYPGHNLKMAKFAKEHGIKVYYYISPKVWAWKKSRIKQLRKYVDKLFIIFPFEIEYFRERGIEAIYEGNPLMDAIAERTANLPSKEEFCEANNIDPNKPLVALLAGSRSSEIKNNLPQMAALARSMSDVQFVVAGVSWLDRELYDKVAGDAPVKYVTDKTYELLSYADAAVVTSGTATLETALIGTPEVVCYSFDPLTMWLAKKLVKIEFISLVNIIMGREVVKELLQKDMSVENASAELRRVMRGGDGHEKMMADYAELAAVVGGAGASDRFAYRMVELLKSENR